MAASHKPRVILGLMTIGPDEDNGARITSLDVFNEVLDEFQARGYTELDTARLYNVGKQEAFTREANWKARGLQIATKVYPLPPGTHKADILTQQFEISLKELGTDCVDIAYLHAPDRSVPFAETLEAMDKLHRAGKFKTFGISNYTAFEVAEIVMTCQYHGWVRPSIYQAGYNIPSRHIEAELIPACRRYGLDIVVYSPIAGGLVAGDYTSSDKNVIPAEGRFSNKFWNGRMRDRYFKDAVFEAARVVREVADQHGLTAVEVALRWMVHHSALNIKDGGNDGVIIGISRLEHLESNLDDLEKGPLPAAVVEALDYAWKVAMPEASPYWHGTIEYTYGTYDNVAAL
ncbi:NADP-dependent oxidoreductase domain-containing protein [Cercophora scortea]|uniref:NADP-dependent oxidoreductase domain-containing protein n=1 Tax=Cercophora scortea TaxID=314031 RepID=A0AAE0IV34_9PEZI|nr:NADP-dependent oxidoreductase domain-containing protein [Cercophora scortea]